MANKKEKKYVCDNAQLMAEWNWEKNEGFSPYELTYGSKKKVWWKCEQGHEWPAIIQNRSRGKGCKECAKLIISKTLHETKLKVGENDFASQCPGLLKEWDYELNNSLVKPDEITVGNNSQKVNWICSACKHHWPSTVYNRVRQKSGCPKCGNQRISKKNKERLFNPDKSLAVLFPEIAAEWHHSKNGDLLVEKIMPGCDDEAWWLCSTCGYEYSARVVSRTGYKHVGCPVCNKYMHTSFPEQALFFYIKKVFPFSINKYTEIFENQMELDVFVPELRVGIEYDGAYWHSATAQDRNRNKYATCKRHGIKLIRIKENYKRYPVCDDDCDHSIYRDLQNDAGLLIVIKNLFRLLSVHIDFDIDISRDRADIKAQYIVSFKERSLKAKFPKLALEWHPTLNGLLKPDMVMPCSSDKVWWLCPKCGYEYPASPSKRTRKKATGCPVCANRTIISGLNDFATVRPDIAREWHAELNGSLQPYQIAPNYSKKVWWKCENCGHEYEKTPNKRVSAGQGCSICFHRNRKQPPSQYQE